jgi:hypothetical protein
MLFAFGVTAVFNVLPEAHPVVVRRVTNGFAFSISVCHGFPFVDAMPLHSLRPRSWALAYVDLLRAWFFLESPTSDYVDTLRALLQCATCDCASLRLLV